jgi:hypothetical protein
MAPRKTPDLDKLVRTLIRYGVHHDHIPQQWTPEVIEAAEAWIAVQAKLKPLLKAKGGRPTGTHAPDGMVSPATHRKRKERANLWEIGIDDKEFDRRFNLRERIKRPRT